MTISNVYLTTDLTKIFYASVENKIISLPIKFIPFLLQAGRIITPSEDSPLQCVFNTYIL